MANVPADLRYTKEHEWAKLEGDKARVGITAFAQEQLGDVVFVELPKVGAKVSAMKTFGVVESVKAVSDLYAPLTGEVVEINAELPKKPEMVNTDPYGQGWMLVIRISVMPPLAAFTWLALPSNVMRTSEDAIMAILAW